MKRPIGIFIVLSMITFFSFLANEHKKPVILSPQVLIHNISYNEFLTQNNNQSIGRIASIEKINYDWAIGTDLGLFIYNDSLTRIIKSYRFDIKSNFNLFDGQDSLVEFKSVEIILNEDKSKFLILTGNGILFQVDTKNYSVDWLIKFVDRIECASYSKKTKQIAIGTRYNYKSKKGRIITEYYASSYIIDSDDGTFIDYFQDYESIKEIEFVNNDSSVIVCYDWPLTDSFLWNLNNKKRNASKYNSEYHNDALLKVSENSFVVSSKNKISLWQLSSHIPLNVYQDQGNFHKILHNNRKNQYWCLATRPGPAGHQSHHLYVLDFNLQEIKQFEINLSTQDLAFTNDDSLVLLTSRYGKNENPGGLYSFNLATEELKLLIKSDTL